MKVKELLSIKGLECFSITSDQSLLDAAKQMAECNIGALLVMNKGSLVGIVTERDIVKNAAKEAKLSAVKIKDAMSTNLLVVKPGDDLDYVMAIMIQTHSSHPCRGGERAYRAPFHARRGAGPGQELESGKSLPQGYDRRKTGRAGWLTHQVCLSDFF